MHVVGHRAEAVRADAEHDIVNVAHLHLLPAMLATFFVIIEVMASGSYMAITCQIEGVEDWIVENGEFITG